MYAFHNNSGTPALFCSDQISVVINFGNHHMCSENHCSVLHTQGLK